MSCRLPLATQLMCSSSPFQGQDVVDYGCVCVVAENLLNHGSQQSWFCRQYSVCLSADGFFVDSVYSNLE